MFGLFITALIPAATLLALLIPGHRLLDPVMIPLQAFFVGLFVYHLALVVIGLRPPEPMLPVKPRSRFAIMVAAHNEEAVIGSLIASIHAQHYPCGLYTIFVVADHCSDRTASAARAAGALVFERIGPGKRGKGPAIEWLLSRVWETDGESDAVVIFDADNLADPSFLAKMDAYLQRGDQVIQGYLGVKNPTDSWITRAITFSYAYTNRFFQLAKQTIGLSSALGGTGLCIAMPLLRRLGWRCEALTEDLEFQIRAILEGVRPTWGWEAVVYDEKPLTFAAAWQQRRRWMQGHASVAVRYLSPLFRRAITRCEPFAWDAVIYLASPLWLSLAFLLTAVFLVNHALPLYTQLYPGWLPPTLIVVSCIYPYLALKLEGLPTRGYLWPSTLAGLLLLSICWPLLGFLGMIHHRGRHWAKTVHTRNLSIRDVHRQLSAAVVTPKLGFQPGVARAVAATMIAMVLFGVVTAHIGAKRLRPPLEEGAVFLLEGQNTKALEQFQAAIEEQPNDAVAHGFLALTYRITGNVFAALREYRVVRRLDPTLGDTTVAMVDFLLRHRAHPNRERLQEQVLNSARTGPDAYVWTANLFIDRKRLQDAEVIILDGIRRLGARAPLLKVQGYLNLARGRLDDAVAVLQAAERQTPNDEALLVNLGWAYYRTGNVAASIRAWERALSINPNNDALRRDLDRAKRLVQLQ
jgi:cellulose synthase/poly-beta-1,6-N-acetylglucosamine synthase-like glycosyltransferase/Tfp pilus assembly protein PilF